MADEQFFEEGTNGSDGSSDAVNPADAFAELAGVVAEAAPDGQYITFSVEAGAPIMVPLLEGETGITINDAITRRHLTLGGVVNAYVEGAQVPHTTFIPAGTVVTMIGIVKGG